MILITYQKLSDIHSSLCSMRKSFTILGEESCTPLLEAFERMSDSDIKKLLMKSSNAFYEPAPMTTWLIKKCQAELTKAVRNIVNISLKAEVFVLSKIIGRTIISEFSKYFLVNNLNETQQSDFRCGHRTETALLRVKNDIIMSIVWFVGKCA